MQGVQPGPVTGLTADADKASWTWASTPDADRYDVVRGWLTSLPYEGDARDAECVGSEIAVSTLFDPDLPVTADGFFYLIRARSGPSASCLNGPWGSADDDAILDCP